MHVHPRHGFLYRTDDVQVGLSREARVNASLQTDLGCAGRGCFHGAARDLIELEVVGRSAQVGGSATLGECAESAVIEADVGVIDVPVYDVGDCVADRFVAQLVSGGDDLVEVAARRGEEAYDVGFGQRVASPCRVEERGYAVAAARAGGFGAAIADAAALTPTLLPTLGIEAPLTSSAAGAPRRAAAANAPPLQATPRPDPANQRSGRAKPWLSLALRTRGVMAGSVHTSGRVA